MRLFEPIHWATSLLASVLRLGAGAGVSPSASPEHPLTLYEFEGCPFCRIAREAVSEAGVPVLVKPCPKAGKRNRPQVKEQGGKAQFPYLIDPNQDVALYESSDIARHIRKHYGGARPLLHLLGPINLLTSQFSVLARLMRGTFTAKARSPGKPLEFWGAERDPGARLVKEVLCEREIDYLWRSAPEPNSVYQGATLKDPNTGEVIAGSYRIRRYILETYAE